MPVDVGSAVGYLDLDISGFLANLKSAQSEADSESKSIASKINANFTSAGKTLTSAGTNLTKKITAPIIGVGTAAVKVTADFDSAMSKVSAISGATGKDFDNLRAKAIEMGAKTKFSATESAEAFTYMAMAGWKTESMLEGIDGIMALSAADGLDLATTSDIVTDALTAFGLEAKDSSHFADVLAKASSSANTNVSMLGESFKYAAPVAGALGYTAEDTAVALGLMANAGIKGSQGGTALRASLSRLIKPTDDAAAMMERYGLSLTNADGTMKPLGNVMNMLRDRLGGLSEAEQAQAAATLFGQEAMSGMLAIINTSDADYKKLTESVYSADGAAQQMADTMLNNLGGQLTLLKSALEGLAIQIGDIIMPYIMKFVEKLQELVQWFQNLDETQKENIIRFAAIVAAIGPVIIVIGKLFTAVGSIATGFSKLGTLMTSLKTGFSALGTAIGGISAPILAIVAVIAVLIGAFVSLWKNNQDFRNKIIAIWNKIVTAFKTFVSGIKERLSALNVSFESITKIIKKVWQSFCNFLAPIFEGAFTQIENIFSAALNIITGILDIFIGLFTGNWNQLWTGIKEVFSAIWNFIKSTFKNVLETMKGILNTALGWFGTSWTNVWTSIKNFFTNIWTSIKTFFTNIISSIKNTLSAFITNVINSFKKIPENISKIIIKVVSTVKSLGTKIKSIGKDIIDGIWTGIKNAKDRFISNFKNFFLGEDGVIGKVTKFLGIGSPSKVFAKRIGRWLPPGIGNGFKSSLPSTIKGMKKDLDKGINSLETDDISINVQGTVMTVAKTFKDIYNELVIWFDSIESRINNSVNRMMQSLGVLIESGRIMVNSDGTLGYVGYGGFSRVSSDTSHFGPDTDETNRHDTGDTFIFYSNESIDEIEAAKQMKSVKRDIAEGF